MLTDDFDHLIRMIYAGACDDDALTQALQMLAEQHRCSSAAFVYADRELPDTDFILTFGPFSHPEVRTRYLSDYAALDPAPRAMAGMPIGKASATDRLFTPEYMARSRFVNEFYRPLGLEEALGGPIISADGRTGLVAIHRGRDRTSFTDEEIATFGRLLPHFGQAVTLRRIFFAAQDGRQGLAKALEPASQGVVVLKRYGEIEFANSKARAVFARNDGLSLTRTGRIELADEDANSRLSLALASLRAPTLLRASRTRSAHPYALRLCPSDDGAIVSARARAVLYVFDPDHRPHDAIATLEAVFGVSQQAAALVDCLLSGGSLATYAASAGVSHNTAKFHLRSVFAATGTDRQSDLVHLATGVLRDLGVTVVPPVPHFGPASQHS